MTPAGLNNGFFILILVGMFVGLFGLVIPFFPGIIVIWFSILGFGLFRGFTWQSGILFVFVTLLMLSSFLVDNVLMGAYSRKTGTSWLAVGLGMLALLVGSIFWTPLGGLLLSFGVVFLIELLRLKDWRRASASLKGMVLGCGWTAVARFGIGLLMIGLWLIWYTLLT
jgi:uncharacterized protein